jgi:hypothetical protein
MAFRQESEPTLFTPKEQTTYPAIGVRESWGLLLRRYPAILQPAVRKLQVIDAGHGAVNVDQVWAGTRAVLLGEGDGGDRDNCIAIGLPKSVPTWQ